MTPKPSGRRSAQRSGSAAHMAAEKEKGTEFTRPLDPNLTLDQASGVADGKTNTGLVRHLEWLEGSAGKGALAIGGLAVSALSLILSTAAARVVVLAPLAFGLAGWLSWRQRRVLLAAVAAVACTFSIVLAIRTYMAPKAVVLFYGGDQMDNSNMPYRDLAGIPLTADPSVGNLYDEILPYSGDGGEIEVSCTRLGSYTAGSTRKPLQWAKISGGQYETLWIPMPFVRGMTSGKARTLLPCDSWRWWLQDPW